LWITYFNELFKVLIVSGTNKINEDKAGYSNVQIKRSGSAKAGFVFETMCSDEAYLFVTSNIKIKTVSHSDKGVPKYKAKQVYIEIFAKGAEEAITSTMMVAPAGIKHSSLELDPLTGKRSLIDWGSMGVKPADIDSEDFPESLQEVIPFIKSCRVVELELQRELRAAIKNDKQCQPTPKKKGHGR